LGTFPAGFKEAA